MKTRTMLCCLVLGGAAVLAPGAAAAADDGAAVWAKVCSKCHGKDGRGDTKVGQKLKVKNYQDPAWQASITDEQMIKTIKEGKGDAGEDGERPMPANADKLSEEQIRAVAAFVRTLGKK